MLSQQYFTRKFIFKLQVSGLNGDLSLSLSIKEWNNEDKKVENCIEFIKGRKVQRTHPLTRSNSIKILVKSRSLESNQTENKESNLKIRFYWVCSWEKMKSATSLTPPSTVFSGTQFSILNVEESLIPKIKFWKVIFPWKQ